MNVLHHDAIRHLEQDLEPILTIMQDTTISEVILNPYVNSLGEIEGHILIQKMNEKLRNLFKYSIQDHLYEDIAIHDVIFYKYNLTNSKKILYWIKLPIQDNDNTKLMINNEVLVHLSSLIRNCFGENEILQTEDIMLYELSQQLKQGHFLVNNLSIQDIIDTLNNLNYNNKKLCIAFKKIINETDKQIFRQHPKKIIIAEPIKMTATKAETIMSILASMTGKFIHTKSPILECSIPKYGYRFTGVVPPVSIFPAFCIRKHIAKNISLDDYVKQGIMQESTCATIRSWVRRKFNILIAGGTNSGKTTLANAIIQEIINQFKDIRLLIIEDVPELKFCTSRSLSFTVGEFFSMYDALRTTLRFKPDRILMGEIRGAEAYTLLKAWNTGHPGGIATIHANGVEEALFRFESCVRDHKDAKINRQEIGFTINGIISIENITVKEVNDGEVVNMVKRKITGLRQIIQYDVINDIYQDIIFDKYYETAN